MEDDKIIILMDHTIHHNEHHAEDFINLANDLEKAGETDAANFAELQENYSLTISTT